MTETCSETHGVWGRACVFRRGWCLVPLQPDFVQSPTHPCNVEASLLPQVGCMPCCPGPISSPSVAVGVRWGDEGGSRGRPSSSTPHCTGGAKAQRGQGTCPWLFPTQPMPRAAPGFLPEGTVGTAVVGSRGLGEFKLHVHRHLSVSKACWLGVAGCWTWGHIPLLPAGLWGRHLCGLSSDLPLPPTASAAVGPCTQAFLSW